MNKLIAMIFDQLLALLHIVFILLMFFLATEKNSAVLNYVPTVFLQSETRIGLVVGLSIVYVCVMGTISVLVSINSYLQEIRDLLRDQRK
jgi:hypothetical protein